jgi:adenosylcobyric acid synthase
MVLGTASGVGKSWLATALCRWYANAGYRVAPFKAQNMSNNARVVATLDGGHGEIGAAQYFQALAARVRPDVRMNPVLLKPEADTRSQVVVNGRVDASLSGVAWRERSEQLWPYAGGALQRLQADHDVVVIEGAGSPAEINLTACDFVNTRTALAAQASCLLVADIDRGGAFAHLFGTHVLMDPGVRALLRGFVLNRFRGDPALLAPAPQELEKMTGVPTLAVLPFDPSHGLPEEDAVAAPLAHDGVVVAIMAAPHLSNHDEFESLRHLPGVRVVWARDPAALVDADWVIVPGSKHTRADLAWLRERGLDAAIVAHAAAGRPVLAICGGLQLLGRDIDDPLGVEGGAPGQTRGLGLLPLRTVFAAEKTLRPVTVRFAALHGCWAPLSGEPLLGYEIHVGRTELVGDSTPLRRALPDGLGWQHGSILAVYAHGLFENPRLVSKLFVASAPALDETFERLASHVDRGFGRDALMQLLDRP